jgi:hypothetical protein
MAGMENTGVKEKEIGRLLIANKLSDFGEVALMAIAPDRKSGYGVSTPPFTILTLVYLLHCRF